MEEKDLQLQSVFNSDSLEELLDLGEVRIENVYNADNQA